MYATAAYTQVINGGISFRASHVIKDDGYPMGIHATPCLGVVIKELDYYTVKEFDLSMVAEWDKEKYGECFEKMHGSGQ